VHLEPRRAERALRQHRALDVAGHRQVVLQREAIGHLEHDQQVEQHEADAEEEGALLPGRDREEEAEAIDLQDGDGLEAGEQLDEADDRRQERRDVERPVRRRQAHREGDEEQPRVGEGADVPRLLVDLAPVDAAREELVGLARVTREEQLQVARLQVLRVDVEERLGALAGSRVGGAGGAGRGGGHVTSRLCVSYP
jgi:hypothetical protein